MKTFLTALCLLGSTFSLFSQTAPIRYGGFMDLYPVGPGAQIGALMTYSPSKWFRLRLEAGPLFTGETASKVWIDGRNQDNTLYYPGIRFHSLALTLGPSIHIGSRVSFDLNLMNFIGAKAGQFHRNYLVPVPGITFRHARWEIRVRGYLPPDVGFGLSYFFDKNH